MKRLLDGAAGVATFLADYPGAAVIAFLLAAALAVGIVFGLEKLVGDLTKVLRDTC